MILHGCGRFSVIKSNSLLNGMLKVLVAVHLWEHFDAKKIGTFVLIVLV